MYSFVLNIYLCIFIFVVAWVPLFVFSRDFSLWKLLSICTRSWLYNVSHVLKNVNKHLCLHKKVCLHLFIISCTFRMHFTTMFSQIKYICYALITNITLHWTSFQMNNFYMSLHGTISRKLFATSFTYKNSKQNQNCGKLWNSVPLEGKVLLQSVQNNFIHTTIWF